MVDGEKVASLKHLSAWSDWLHLNDHLRCITGRPLATSLLEPFGGLLHTTITIALLAFPSFHSTEFKDSRISNGSQERKIYAGIELVTSQPSNPAQPLLVFSSLIAHRLAAYAEVSKVSYPATWELAGPIDRRRSSPSIQSSHSTCLLRAFQALISSLPGSPVSWQKGENIKL